MNQAFVKENDGWQMCKEKRESCLFADENGYCMLNECRLYGGPVQRPPEENHKQ